MAGIPVNKSTTIYGDKLMLYYGGLPIALGQSCEVSISADTLDTTSKMSGDWKEFLTGQLSYTISSESLLTYSSTANTEVDLTKYSTFKDLVKLMQNRNPVEFKIATAKDKTQDYAIDAEFITGKAIITQCTANAPSGQLSTCTIQMQGTGELSISDEFTGPADDTAAV